MVKHIVKKQKKNKDKGYNFLFCTICAYVHPTGAGLKRHDICPECGDGIMERM
jgi:rRNA maturation endonuclease Nob1